MGESIFGKYEIRRRLAVGGMGEVFYAVQRGVVKGFERPVILKNLLPDLAAQPQFIEQFLDEARVAATLNHPNVVSIYEVGLWNNVYFIAMEFIEGCNLAELTRASLAQGLPTSPLVAAQIIHDAAQGLFHAHSARDGQQRPLNIVHRDISPQNIMVRRDGVTKVVDFGVALAANRATRTATGAVKGKLAYMAPEQALGRTVSGLADQFGLGIVLWELLTRRRLFSAERDLDLFKLVLEAPIPPPSSIVPGTPAELDAIVARMTDRDPSKRFGDCREVALALQGVMLKLSPPTNEPAPARFLRALGLPVPVTDEGPVPAHENFVISLNEAGSALAPSSERTVSSRMPPPKRLNPLVPAAVLGLLAALGGAWALLAQPNRAEPQAPPPPPRVAVVAQPAVIDAGVLPERPKSARLRIVSSPDRARVKIHGVDRGRTPLSMDVDCDLRDEAVLELPNYEPYRQQLRVEGCEGLQLKVQLKKVPPIPPVVPTTGKLTINTDPPSSIFIDGILTGENPVQVVVPTGPHVVTVHFMEDAGTRTQTVTVGPDGRRLHLTPR